MSDSSEVDAYSDRSNGPGILASRSLSYLTLSIKTENQGHNNSHLITKDS